MRGNFRRDRHQHLIDDFGARLRADLEMRRHAPDSKEHTPTAYVFGDACGGKVGSIRRAWDTANLYAHGYTPVWIGKGKLAPESRAALKTINLHFHDLRRQLPARYWRAGRTCTTCATSWGTPPSPRRRSICNRRHSGWSARWFINPHFGVGFDVRVHHLAAGDLLPKQTAISIAAGMSLK